MKIRIDPLQGKYYRSSVSFLDDEGKEVGWAEFGSGGWEPSKRQIEDWGYTQEDWDKNVEVDDGWGSKCPIQESDFRSDGHFERKETYEIIETLKKLVEN